MSASRLSLKSSLSQVERVVRGGVFLMSLGLVALATERASAAVVAPEKELTQVVEQFTQAQVGFAPDVLRELTAPEYIEVSPLGEVDPRDKMLGFYAPENKMEAPSATTSDFNIRILGETAVVIVKVTFQKKGADASQPVHALRESFVARKTKDGWKLVSAQYTGVAPKH